MTSTVNLKTADGWTHLNNLETLGDIQVDGNLTVLGSINGEDQIVTGIIAHAGGMQTNATLLTAGAFNNIVTVATTADSVKLPPSVSGLIVTVSNQGANAAQIFGTSPDTINGVATGTGISIPVGAIFEFTCVVAGNWLQNVQTGGAFTGTFDGVLGGNTPAAASVTTLTATGAIAGGSSSNIAINTNKFTVAASTGNTLVAGTLAVTGVTTLTDDLIGGASTDIAINTNKFTVAAATGNTLVAGTLAVSGNATLTTYLLESVGNGLTAAGTTRTDALQLAKQINNVTTAGSGTGVILPVGAIGMRITVFNAGANAIQVYASASETIDTVAGATGVPLTNTKRADFFFTAANTWISAQLGVVSA